MKTYHNTGPMGRAFSRLEVSTRPDDCIVWSVFYGPETSAPTVVLDARQVFDLHKELSRWIAGRISTGEPVIEGESL